LMPRVSIPSGSARCRLGPSCGRQICRRCHLKKKNNFVLDIRSFLIWSSDHFDILFCTAFNS
jgi:hypothetical protein